MSDEGGGGPQPLATTSPDSQSPPPSVPPQGPGSGPARPARSGASIVRLVGPLTTALMCLGLVAYFVYQLQEINQQQANQIAAQQAELASKQEQIDALQLQIQDLKARWFGSPPIWQPPPISNTDINFFDVTGTTQGLLIDSLDNSNICAQYPPCTPDPAVPNGVAWGLEGVAPVGSHYYCYSPRSTTVSFREFVVLPRWSPPTDGTVKIPLVEKWNALVKVIYTHEAGHVAITQQDIADLNGQAQQLATCSAVFNFWANPHVFDKLNADQAAYHARLHADCRPEIGCFLTGWNGW